MSSITQRTNYYIYKPYRLPYAYRGDSAWCTLYYVYSRVSLTTARSTSSRYLCIYYTA